MRHARSPSLAQAAASWRQWFESTPAPVMIACVNRFAEKKLELARLVPAERQAREIVAFHVDRDPAQRGAKAWRGFERGRQMRERYARPAS